MRNGYHAANLSSEVVSKMLLKTLIKKSKDFGHVSIESIHHLLAPPLWDFITAKDLDFFWQSSESKNY
jgi:hypothetical protein